MAGATRGAGRAIAVELARAYVGRGIAALAADPGLARYAGRVLTSAELARAYGLTDVDGSRPDCWRYVVEIQDQDRAATETGYR